MCFLALCLPLLSQAQTVKQVSVSADEPFTDHLTLQQDSKDTDLMVKFQFDEANNTLTVSLVSYRSLFVFQDDTRYRQVVRHKRLRPERFPYVVTAADHQQFRLSKPLRKTISHPRRKHIFRQWLTTEGLLPRPAEFQMVNDFIEQQFDIKNHQSVVTVTLRDVFLMERDTKHTNKWQLLCGRDFNTRYQVAIRRNPCFGLEADLQTASQSLTDLQKSYKSFRAKYGGGKVTSQEAMTLFQKTQNTLLQQFPRRTVTSACPDLQGSWDSYNLLLDSISMMQCKLELPPVLTPEEEAVGGGTIDATNICSRARQIDELVGRWLLTTDEIERRDIKAQCAKILKDTNALIRIRGMQTEEQRRAVKVFREAERYYYKTIH
ncbi:MAG: hypothetical protein J5545_01260 [Bacteroidaceae bacterium]|nr:hypothetical protein [Bacteroidaceae bacterium]